MNTSEKDGGDGHKKNTPQAGKILVICLFKLVQILKIIFRVKMSNVIYYQNSKLGSAISFINSLIVKVSTPFCYGKEITGPCFE